MFRVKSSIAGRKLRRRQRVAGRRAIPGSHGGIRPHGLRRTPAARGACAGGHHLPGGAGRDHRNHRRYRLRQIHAGEPDPAVLRCHPGQGGGERPGRAGVHPGTACAASIGVVPQKAVLFKGTLRDNHALGQGGRLRRGHLLEPWISPRPGSLWTRRAMGWSCLSSQERQEPLRRPAASV